MKKTKIIVILAVVMVGIVAVVKFTGGKPSVQVELTQVSKKEIQPSILASGNFVFRQQVQLSTEVMGKVAEVLVREGDKVDQGQILLRLDPTLIRAELAQQKASLRNAEVNIDRAQLNVDRQQVNSDRTKRLAEAKFIDTVKYEDALHQLNITKVDLRGARESFQQVSAALDQTMKRLDKTEVRAPISGTITAVQIKIGETAVASATGMAGSSLMTIADIASIMAEVNVDEADIAKIIVGQTAKVFPAAFDEQAIIGKVDEVSMAPRSALAGASQGKSYIVKLRLPETKLMIRTGMTCRVEIITGGGSAKPVLPIQAILSPEISDEKGKRESREILKGTGIVYTFSNGVVQKKRVKLGIADDNNQEIVSGVTEGDKVVVGPARVLRGLNDGDKVAEMQNTDKESSKNNNVAKSAEEKADGKK